MRTLLPVLKTFALSLLIAACLLSGTSTARVSAQSTSVTASNAAAIAAARAAREKKEREKKAAEATADARANAEADASVAKPDPAATLKVHDGDPIQLRFTQEVNSKTAKQGDPVFLELAQDLKVGDVVVAKAGSRAMGEVVWVEKAGFLGHGGDLEVRLDYLRVGEKKIRLRGMDISQAGAGRSNAAAALTLTVGVGLFIRGKDMQMKQGAEIKAYLGDDAALAPA